MRTRVIARGLLAASILSALVAPTSSGAVEPQARRRPAFVRVNQLGYPSDAASKRAYLMSSIPAGGSTFSVETGGGAVYTAPVGRDLGRWSRAFPHVYALDFGTVVASGTYRIVVPGEAAATSPPFEIGTGQAVYDDALANALRFYEVQRDGPDYIPSALRTAPGHLHDMNAMTYRRPTVNSEGSFRGDLDPLGRRIDASGGWWDAGDYLKFVHASSYTDALLLTGIRDFPNQMGAGASANGSDFTDEAEFGTRWLLHMWDDARGTLYYQVGIGSGNDATVGDHDIWRLPQADDAYHRGDPRFRYIRHRPVFRAGPPGSPISPNLAGRLSAAFALCFQVYRTTKPALATDCLRSAEHVFDLADTSPGRLLTAIPYSFYPETEWRDDLEFGATELSLALAAGGLPSGLPHTDPDFYLHRAARWADAYITGPNDAADTLNLYDVSGLAHYELHRAITAAGAPSGLAVTRGQLVRDMRKALDASIEQSRRDPFGFGFAWAQWDTTTHGAGLSVMASEVDELTGTTDYAVVADRWLANILGANAWGLSLIVGDGTRFPQCLQHQVANLAGSLDGSSPVLLGAAVEGPNHHGAHGTVRHMVACPPDGNDPFVKFDGRDAEFRDNVQSYPNTEPAIDLTATSPLAFARQAEGLR